MKNTSPPKKDKLKDLYSAMRSFPFSFGLHMKPAS